ncbi:MAG: YgjV family protein [Bacilli bacterium]|nr:YgjV family protein [Bacilli bacterium]
MWNNVFWVIAFSLGIIIICLSLTMFLLPKKNSHLFIKLLFDLTYIVQMLFIFFATHTYGVFIAIASNTVGAIRDIAFMKSEEKENRFYWAIGLSMLMIASLYLSYDSVISYLPVIGTLINTTALALIDKKKTCALTMFGQIFFISYYALLAKESDFLTSLNIVSAVMLFISSTIGLIIGMKKNSKALDK